jgi:hypothetical protein
MDGTYIEANEQLKLDMFKLYQANIIGKPYRNDELYSTLEKAYKNCDIKIPKYIDNYICKDDKNNKDDVKAMIDISIDNGDTSSINIENVGEKRDKFMNYLVSFNNDQKKAVSFNNTILYDLKNQRLQQLENNNKKINQDYMKYYLINNNDEKKTKAINMFLKPFLITIIALSIIIIILCYKIFRAHYPNHSFLDF